MEGYVIKLNNTHVEKHTLPMRKDGSVSIMYVRKPHNPLDRLLRESLRE